MENKIKHQKSINLMFTAQNIFIEHVEQHSTYRSTVIKASTLEAVMRRTKNIIKQQI